MEVFIENIIGSWQKEDTGIVYRFYKSGNLIIHTKEKQVAESFEIVTKERKSYLLIGPSKFPFIIMNPGSKVPYFSIATKKGLVCFYRSYTIT